MVQHWTRVAQDVKKRLWRQRIAASVASGLTAANLSLAALILFLAYTPSLSQKLVLVSVWPPKATRVDMTDLFRVVGRLPNLVSSCDPLARVRSKDSERLTEALRRLSTTAPGRGWSYDINMLLRSADENLFEVQRLSSDLYKAFPTSFMQTCKEALAFSALSADSASKDCDRQLETESARAAPCALEAGRLRQAIHRLNQAVSETTSKTRTLLQITPVWNRFYLLIFVICFICIVPFAILLRPKLLWLVVSVLPMLIADLQLCQGPLVPGLGLTACALIVVAALIYGIEWPRNPYIRG
jgi:hypothetical protein